ncbi:MULTISPECIES: hypothetical protein [unclassified Variovorax]|uniref:hypothetical protein n=1 Tax=unclassified Variovorax TaxID=663243 RepID=UPI00076D08F5|nr:MULTISPECIES: hypothetical protein [unclassified Variovorax]KWT98421.1 hypothetical protein APY03_0556 [Variovorax sp. WDL1]PNG49910.1 hypothetical protein CHC06_05491 [Variovorax sp. B2]PNG50782.1 hypothetical protein CHC07_05396 [Variovorax sp. B4]
MLLTRDHLVKLGSGVAGGALSLALAHFMAPSVALILPKPPTPVRVTMKAPSAASVAAATPATAAGPGSEKELRLKSDKPVEAPKPKAKPKPKPRPAAPKPPQKVAEDASSAPAVVSPSSDLPTLSQPAFPQGAPNAALPNLPAMAAALDEAPEAPPESLPEGPRAKVYPEEQGGNVLVLGLLVNDQGVVIDSDILVSSFKPLSDIAVAWASIGQTWTNLQPPLNPGETRWIELRIPFVPDTDRLKTLP